MILEKIIARKRQELAERMERVPLAELERRLRDAPPTRDFARAISGEPGHPVRLIAEFKRASPSKGPIRTDLDPAEVARGYEAAGASAVSVLTDRTFFAGTLRDLERVRARCSLPILRKDFTLSVYDLYEARVAGADAVLLIAAVLSEAEIRQLIGSAGLLGLAAVVEVHDEAELCRALAAGAKIVGINNRNLSDFSVDIETTFRLRPMVPDGVTIVSESGISKRATVLRLQEARVDAVLVGEYLMRRPSPADAVRELLGTC